MAYHHPEHPQHPDCAALALLFTACTAQPGGWTRNEEIAAFL